MKTKKTVYFLLMFLPLIITVTAFPFLPEEIPAHYNFAGEVDRWGSKYETLIFPLCIVGIGLFMLLMAKIAGKNEKDGKNNEKIVFYTGMGLSLFFTVEHCYFLFMDFKKASNLGDFETDINQLLCIMLGISLVVIGNFMPKLRTNSVIGLRTPWSDKNDTVWKKCQIFGGVSLIICGIITVICGIFLDGYTAMCVFLGIIILCMIADTVYSYFAAKKY